MKREITLILSLTEAAALSSVANAGSESDMIDNIGLTDQEKKAFRRADHKLTRSIIAAAGRE